MRIKLHAIIFTLIDNQVYRIICYYLEAENGIGQNFGEGEGGISGTYTQETDVVYAGSDSGYGCGIQFQVEMQIFDIKQMSEHRRVETCLHDGHVCNTLNGSGADSFSLRCVCKRIA